MAKGESISRPESYLCDRGYGHRNGSMPNLGPMKEKRDIYMIQIRKGVFETNSSSSHSIVMMKENKPTKTELEGNMVDGEWHVDDNGVMNFWYEPDLEFGRSPFDLLTDWYGRLRYCIASYSSDNDKIEELEEICRRRIAGFTSFKFRIDQWDNELNRGYVDHQSSGLLSAALNKFNVSLEEFIFDDRFVVVIDGDEYCVFDTLIGTDMFNKENIQDIISADDAIDNGGWKE